jgi:ketosteroid isomerase-like protein
MQMWAGAFSNMRLKTLAIVGGESHVAGEFVGTGTHDGSLVSPGGTVPPTGRTMSERFTWFADVTGGRLVGVRDYYNAMAVMSQLGLMPAPSEP